MTLQIYEGTALKLAEWAATDLTVLTLPRHHRRRLRTSNAIEVVNREIKRRT